MVQIEFKAGGAELAKVLHYYGLLEGEPEFKIVCPFHNDINASMKINLIEGSFYCFGCGKSGDALQFVILANKKISELDACKLYFKILKSKKVKHIETAKYTKLKKNNLKSNLKALDEAHDYYFGLAETDWANDTPERSYMIQRGFTESALSKYNVKINYNSSYPIIFPIFDMGDFKGWVCRTMSKRIQQNGRKYLYNEGLVKTNILVGSYNAEVVVLVEGYMDWLKMKQFGVKKVAAILGWKISEQQIKKLQKQGVKIIISALDNDECGNKGTEFLKAHFKVVRFQYPDGVKDSGEMNVSAFRKAREKTKIEFRRLKRKWGL